MGMNSALVGKEYQHLEAFTVTAEGARAFADATQAELDAYRAPHPLVPPMYPVAAAAAALGAPLFDPSLRLEFMRLNLRTLDVRFLASVRVADTLRTTAKILDINQAEGGEVITIGLDVQNQHGAPVVAIETGLFVRSPRQRTEPNAHSAAALSRDTRGASATPLWSAPITVDLDQGARYGRAAGDMNPVHTDPDVARMAGLPAPVLHELCTLAFVHNACTQHSGGTPERVQRLTARFRRPVLLGETVKTEARGPAEGPWQLCVVHSDGSVVIDEAVVELR